MSPTIAASTSLLSYTKLWAKLPRKSFQRAMMFSMLSLAPPLAAQVATGDVLGTVTDNTGAIVPGALHSHREHGNSRNPNSGNKR